MRFFNTAGPCKADLHYQIRPDTRLEGVEALIEGQSYFVVHAPRQTGKTTTLMALARRLTTEGRYTALHFSCETGRAFSDVETVERLIWLAIELAARENLPLDLRPPPTVPSSTGGLLTVQLKSWCESSPRPLVLFFDEIDALQGEPLKSVLSQLRAGYPSRPQHFPWSVVLCGLKDVRDYKIESGGVEPRTGSSSPFNIKVESLRLGNFTRDQVLELYGQHTAETGQVFTTEALERAWDLTRGQPWLTNALAREVVQKIGVPPDQAITPDHLDQAKERLILARATHLDSLLARLREDRVREVLEPVLVGGLTEIGPTDDNYQYVLDLGLIAPTKPPEIANPIYREVITRVLAEGAEYTISSEYPSYVMRSGRLDFPGLMAGFIDFWTEHGDILVGRMPYPEAAPMLVLMAWLHKAVNGTGYIEREVGVGRKRIDLLVRWPYTEGGQRVWQREALELKVWRDTDRRGDPEPKGVVQLDQYLTKMGLDTGWLVVFDAREAAPDIEERTRVHTATTPSARIIQVLRA